MVCILCGFPAAHWIGGKMGEFISCLPTEKYAVAPPALGIPASKAVRGDLQGAVEAYEELLLVHPHEKEIYFRLLEIVLGPMAMEQYGEDVLQRGLRNLKSGPERLALISLADSIRGGEYHPFQHYGHHA